MAEREDGFIKRSSSEQAKVNEEAARKPSGQASDASNAQSLTGHTVEPEVVTDDDGNVIASHQTRVITDPESPEAVQVPDPDEHPGANATKANPLGAQAEPTPNQVAAGDAEADVTVSEKDDEAVRAGQIADDNDD